VHHSFATPTARSGDPKFLVCFRAAKSRPSPVGNAIGNKGRGYRFGGLQGRAQASRNRQVASSIAADNAGVQRRARPSARSRGVDHARRTAAPKGPLVRSFPAPTAVARRWGRPPSMSMSPWRTGNGAAPHRSTAFSRREGRGGVTPPAPPLRKRSCWLLADIAQDPAKARLESR